MAFLVRKCNAIPTVRPCVHSFSRPLRDFALGCYKDSLIGSGRFNSAVLAVRLALRGLRSFTPSGFMLAHVFFIPFISSFVLVSHETSSPSGLFTFVFELAHMALNSFASGQLHYQASIFYCCVDSQCVYGRILPCIFVLILVEVLKDALQPNFQQVEDR